MKSLVHIGADVEQVKKVLPNLTIAIMKILNSSAGDDVKKKALDSLTGAYEVKNNHLENCSFISNEK